jgi:release factor glutamine methyltransferase
MSVDLSLRSLLRESLLPSNEARMLMAHILDLHYQLPRSAILSRDEMTLNAEALKQWQALEARRMKGEPVAYLIGKKGFHNIELYVAPGVLIPRPETELLVDIGLQEISRIGTQAQVLDLGTGSGAIALAIAHEENHALVTATDQSTEALKIAETNAKLLNVMSQVKFLQGSWYRALNPLALFDIILSNPPYISSQDKHLEKGDLRFEPISALTDHATGLSCIELIIGGAMAHLKPHGLIAIEHGFDQSEAVVGLMKTAGLQDIQTHLDLAGHHRVVSGRKM